MLCSQSCHMLQAALLLTLGSSSASSLELLVVDSLSDELALSGSLFRSTRCTVTRGRPAAGTAVPSCSVAGDSDSGGASPLAPGTREAAGEK
jgi:hypothetical protein